MPLIIDEWHQCSQDFEFHIASSGGKLAAGKKRNGGISESPEEYEEESKCSKLPSFTVHQFVTRYKTKPQVQHTPPTSTSLWTKYIKKPGTGAKGGAYCTAEISCACCTMEPSTNRTDFCAFEKIWRLRYKTCWHMSHLADMWPISIIPRVRDLGTLAPTSTYKCQAELYFSMMGAATSLQICLRPSPLPLELMYQQICVPKKTHAAGTWHSDATTRVHFQPLYARHLNIRSDNKLQKACFQAS